ncbi:YcxB family protein [Streptacidiphilus sp. P02-A3a]|uniref:YcxB family protein n=1 Tax=Streptacidiphilus sp. P02-A3a TaxID=2704468 RepID=UPI0015F92A1B|nr:YcxB family protein [Streptacidiphilus sp. P02-A3a]QMU68287.1 YcxB family protein [Streptacidiphilus sp. P02-A3a]
MRSLPALVIVGAMALLALLAMPPLPAATGIAAFLAVSALALTWRRSARRATAAAEDFAGPYTISLSDSGITTSGASASGELSWDEVTHATKSQGGWLFVANRGNVAIPLPTRLLSDAETGQVHQLLSAWPMRRYRRTPW